MHYRLDPSIESLVHALCEAVLLKGRLALVPHSAESMILRDMMEDLSRGIGLRCGLPQDAAPGQASLTQLVWEIHRCTETWHVARAFHKMPPLDAYLMSPYFSQGDLKHLENWNLASHPPDAPAGGGQDP